MEGEVDDSQDLVRTLGSPLFRAKGWLSSACGSKHRFEAFLFCETEKKK